MQRVTSEGKRWFSETVDFSRKDDRSDRRILSSSMRLNMFSCNSQGPLGCWGQMSFSAVNRFRKRYKSNLDDLSNNPSPDRAIDTIARKLHEAQKWGKKLAKLFLNEALDDEKTGPHVVILPCPNGLESLIGRLKMDNPILPTKTNHMEACFRKCYSRHLAYQMGLSFAGEVAYALGDWVSVILPHGILVPRDKPTNYGYTYKTRAYLLQHPSETALSTILKAKQIHIIDDNLVYGGTMARMIVGAFLLCEKVGNLDAKLHSHTWYSKQTKSPKQGGGLTMNVILDGTQDIGFVKEATLQQSNRTFAESDGVIGVHSSGKIVHGSEKFWNAYYFAFAGRTEDNPSIWSDARLPSESEWWEISDKQGEMESRTDIEASWSQKRQEESRTGIEASWHRKRQEERELRQRQLDESFQEELLALEENLKATMSRVIRGHDSRIQKRREVKQLDGRISGLNSQFPPEAVRKWKDDNRALLKELRWRKSRLENSPWNAIENGKFIDFTLIKVSEIVTGDGFVKKSCSPSSEFRNFVGTWEHLDNIDRFRGFTLHIKQLNDSVEEFEKLGIRHIRLHRDSQDVEREIKDIYEKCILKSKSIRRRVSKCFKKLPSWQVIFPSHKIKILIAEKIRQVKKITWDVSMLWDSEEKAEKGAELEAEEKRLIARLRKGELTIDHHAIAELHGHCDDRKMAILQNLKSIDERIARARIAIDVFWEDFRNESDLQKKMQEGHAFYNEIEHIAEGRLRDLEKHIESNKDLVRRFSDNQLEEAIINFKEFSNEFR